MCIFLEVLPESSQVMTMSSKGSYTANQRWTFIQNKFQQFRNFKLIQKSYSLLIHK